MTRRARRNHTPAFKAKVVLSAVKDDWTLAQLAEQFDVHPNQITSWKAQLEAGPPMCSVRVAAAPRRRCPPSMALHAEIGELALENDS